MNKKSRLFTRGELAGLLEVIEFALTLTIDKCAYCGKLDSLKPFGANNENICFDCSHSDQHKAMTDKKSSEMISAIIDKNNASKH